MTDGLRDEFLKVWNTVLSSILDDVQHQDLMPQDMAYIEQMLRYNVPGGKHNRGISVVTTAGNSFKVGHFGDEERFQTSVLGWCVELLQAFFLVADDVMDESLTRRGNPCWYKVPSVGLKAVNDSLMMEILIYRVLRSHFREHPAYHDIVDIFHTTTFQTELGQLLDMSTSEDGGYKNYTMERYKRIVRYKTAFYSFYLPVALGLTYAGVSTTRNLAVAEEICCEMGEYFQIQDDFLDCYGDQRVIGKVGTDIQDAKCSWLFVRAVEKCDKNQKSVLIQNYASTEPEKVARVKDIYNQLDLKSDFFSLEESSYKRIVEIVEANKEMDGGVDAADVFFPFLKMIYKRKM